MNWPVQMAVWFMRGPGASWVHSGRGRRRLLRRGADDEVGGLALDLAVDVPQIADQLLERPLGHEAGVPYPCYALRDREHVGDAEAGSRSKRSVG